jgi:hypothetical protein
VRNFPEVVTGYELEKAEWSVIIPTREDTFNLVENPSLETNITGYNAMAGAITRKTTGAAFGVYALECTPAVGINDGCWYGELSLSNGKQYFFSLYFSGGDIGQKYRIYFADNIGGRKGGYKEFIAKGYMQRIWISWFCEYDGPFRFYCVKSGHAGIKSFYIDGLQVEEDYFTTYIDGDQKGFMPEINDYYWMGDEHGSQSVRIGQSRHGGREVKLKTLGFSLLAVTGLGLGGFQNSYSALAAGGETYDGTYKTGRNFALTGALTGKDFSEFESVKSKMYEYFSPDFVSPNQPLRLIYRDKKCGENELFHSIPCVFDGGLEGDFNNYFQERVSMKFHCWLPWTSEKETEMGYNLAYQKYIANTDTVVLRGSDGRYFDSGFPTGNGTAVTYYKGKIYVIRYVFTHDLYSIDPVTHVSTLIAQFDDFVYELKVRGDDLYAVGAFTTIDGNPFLRIARYDGTIWSAVGAGINNGIVKSIDIADDGTIYIAGNFTNQPNAGNHAAAYFSSGAWNDMDGGLTITDPLKPISVAVGKDGKIWYGGDFIALNDGLGTAVEYITYWESGAFQDIAGFSDHVIGVGVGVDGVVYAVGMFIVKNHAAYWDGVAWNQLGPGLDIQNYSQTGRRIFNIKEGILFSVIFDATTWTRYGEFPGEYSIWNGNAFVPGDHEVSLPANGYEEAQEVYSSPNNLLMAIALNIFPAMVHNFTTAEITEISNSGNFNAWPIFKFTGPGMLRSIKNMTTGKYIWFDTLQLQDGETLTLSLSPHNLYFTSNIRGNMLSYIYPGSAVTEFYIKPGKNNISTFISGFTGALTKATLKFFPVFGSKK